MPLYNPTISLKEQCQNCHGTGAYEGRTPCWTCHGRGWVYSIMPKPNPKWATQYKKEHPPR